MSIPIKFLHDGEWVDFERVRNVNLWFPDEYEGYRTMLEFECLKPSEGGWHEMFFAELKPVMLWGCLATEFRIDAEYLPPGQHVGDLVIVRLKMEGGKLLAAHPQERKETQA